MHQVFENMGDQNFWVGVFFGQVIFVGGLFWFIASLRKTNQKENQSKTESKVE